MPTCLMAVTCSMLHVTCPHKCMHAWGRLERRPVTSIEANLFMRNSQRRKPAMIESISADISANGTTTAGLEIGSDSVCSRPIISILSPLLVRWSLSRSNADRSERVRSCALKPTIHPHLSTQACVLRVTIRRHTQAMTCSVLDTLVHSSVG